MSTKNFNLLIGLCFTIALFSCKKEGDNIGGQLISNPDTIRALEVDTFAITSYSVIEDSIITNEQSTPLLGAYNSAETGLASSSIFVSLVPDTLDNVFPSTNFEIDSFYLQLNILDVYGTPGNNSFEVYRITQPVATDSTYYNFDEQVVSDLMGTITINETDSGIFTFDLDSAYGAQIMQATANDLSSNDNFTSFFSGIAIKPITSGLAVGSGAIYKLARTGVELHLIFKTTNGTDANFDLTRVYDINTDDNIYAGYSHDITGSETETIINDTILGQNSFYVQGLAGPFGKLNFPSVQTWYNDSNNYLINQFQLVVYVEDNSTFALPDELMFTYNNTEGIRTFSTAAFNASDNSYTFIISPSEVSVQLAANTFNTMDFAISQLFPATSPEQVKLFGSASSNPPKLKISYTRY